jgi:molybdopterin converting factor small subunit
MPVKMNLYPWLSQVVGGKEAINVNGSTIGECLDKIESEHPGVKELLLNKEGNVKSYVFILLNGENAYPEELSKPVKDGDEISILLFTNGG